MKKTINKKYLSIFIFFLGVVVFVKALWLGISLYFLPYSGIEYHPNKNAKALYYRVRLHNASPTATYATTAAARAEEIRRKQLQMRNISMKGYNLIALYHSSDKIVITVEKGRKTTVLGRNDKVDGFTLIAAGSDYAIFIKQGKQYTLSLSKIKTPMRNSRPSTKKRVNKNTTATIVESEGGVKVINRNLLTSYTKDMKKIWSDIGIAPNSVNGRLKGYKINYVRRNSDFEKLGLRRGDILVAINAEELNSISAAMNVFNEINNIENLTLTVERNGIREDIEYEIQ